MNSLLYYYNNVQKMAAYRQAKRMQRGTKLGYDEPPALGTTTKFVTPAIAIGTDDFSLEYYGNTYGGGVSTGRYNIYQAGIFSAGPTSIGQNGIYNISLGGESIGVFNFNLPDLEESFHLAVTRQGTTVKVYINGELKATKEQSEVKDLGDLQLAIANSSDVGFVRVWNYALSADEIATLYNNNDPMGYVVPKAKRDSLLAEYLPQNLMYSKDDKAIATSWLDSAKQMPLSDEYMEPLFQSIGGYDMAANGAPEILYNE